MGEPCLPNKATINVVGAELAYLLVLGHAGRCTHHPWYAVLGLLSWKHEHQVHQVPWDLGHAMWFCSTERIPKRQQRHIVGVPVGRSWQCGPAAGDISSAGG